MTRVREKEVKERKRQQQDNTEMNSQAANVLKAADEPKRSASCGD